MGEIFSNTALQIVDIVTNNESLNIDMMYNPCCPDDNFVKEGNNVHDQISLGEDLPPCQKQCIAL